jgi:hypothetical protein
MGLALACGLLWLERRELAYLLSPREPISLGDERAYRFERLASNRYAEIHGIPTPTGAFSRDGERIQYRAAFEMLGGRWILLDGERPGADGAVALLGAALVAFALLNLWWLARDVARRIQARRSTTVVKSLR